MLKMLNEKTRKILVFLIGVVLVFLIGLSSGANLILAISIALASALFAGVVLLSIECPNGLRNSKSEEENA